MVAGRVIGDGGRCAVLVDGRGHRGGTSAVRTDVLERRERRPGPGLAGDLDRIRARAEAREVAGDLGPVGRDGGLDRVDLAGHDAAVLFEPDLELLASRRRSAAPARA